MVPFPVSLNDGNGYIWDFQSKGGINLGTGGAFDGAFLNLDLPNILEALEALNGRMLTVQGPSNWTPNIALSRSMYVPTDQGWARFVDTATNTGPTAVTYTFRFYSDLGADLETTVADSSSGDALFGLTDDWVRITGGTVPDVGMVFGNTAETSLSPTEAWIAGDDLVVGWRITLQPGETASILQFALQDNDLIRLQQNIDDLSGELTDAMLEGLDWEVLQTIRNFEVGEITPPQQLYLGNGTADVMIGSNVAEVFDALGGDDVILAAGGDDHVMAGAGNDVVHGGAGDDLLEGGPGNDVMSGGEGADRLIGDGVTGTTLSGQGVVAETGASLALSLRLPEAAPDESVHLDGIVGRGVHSLSDLRLVYLIDTSSSMTGLLSGGGAGDRDRNGFSDQLMDGAIAGFEALTATFAAAGLHGAELTVIGFSGSSTVSYRGLVGGDVTGGLEVLSPGGSTGYTAALEAARDALGPSTGGDVMITMLSDGFPDASDYGPVAAELRDPDGLNATIRTVAFGPNAGLSDLDMLDDGVIDGSVLQANTLSELIDVLTGGPVAPSEIAGVSLRVNGQEVATLVPGDLHVTPLGLHFAVELAGLTIGQDDVIEAVLTASDGAATQITVSGTLPHDGATAGNDILSGDEGDDWITGDAGHDVLMGGPGDDILSGGLGDDVLIGGDGTDMLVGGAGDDLIQGGPGADYLHGGAGTRDIVSYAGSNAGVTVNLATQTASGGHADGDVLSGFEGVEGSSFDDVLIGSDGDDILRPGLGADEVYGGAGFDIVDYSNADAAVIVSVSAAGGRQTTGAGDKDFLDSIEGVIGSRFDDRLFGTNAKEYFHGGDGDDFIRSRGGGDEVHGGAGNDVLRGEGGDHVMYGGDGDDYILTGAGNDLAFGGAGNDVIKGYADNDTLHGGDGNDRLEGMAGNDVLYGSGGDDTMLGGVGRDELYGGEGNDRLYGENGRDLLDGGAGDDILFGGANADTFLFQGAWGFDVIRDFEVNVDEIDVRYLRLADYDDFLSYGLDRDTGVRFVFENGEGFFIADLQLADLDPGDVLL